MRGPAQQFVDRELEPNEGANARDQGDFVDRLGQKIVRAGIEAAHPVGGPVKRGQENDRQMSGFRRGSEAPANLETVHAGHLHVEKDDVASALFANRDRIRTVGRRQHLEIFNAEFSPEAA